MNIPRYQQIASTLRDEIDDGTWPTGSYLPPESKLAERFGVAPGTVRQALKTLVEEGTLSARRGAKKIVMRESRPRMEFQEFRSFAQWAIGHGLVPSGLVISADWEPATEIDRRHFRAQDIDSVLSVVRLRSIDDTPVMVERTRYPEKIGRQVETLPSDTASVTNELSQRFGVEFVAADHGFRASIADEFDAKLLGVDVGHPLLCHLRISRDRFGTTLEWSEDRYRSGVVTLSVSTVENGNPLNWDPYTPTAWML